MYVFCLQLCLPTMFMECSQKPEVGMTPVVLELLTILSQYKGKYTCKYIPGPLQDQLVQALLSAELSLPPLFFD